MYHNQSFFNSAPYKEKPFYPNVISAFKILTDEMYFHKPDDDEKSCYPKDTVCFIRCTAGAGKIYTKSEEITINENEYVCIKFHDIIKYKSLSHIWSYRWVNFTLEHSQKEIFKIRGTAAVTEYEERSFDKLLFFGNSDSSCNMTNYAFLDYFYRVCEKEKIESAQQAQPTQNRQIDDICSYINQMLFSKTSVDTVSAFFKITPRRLHQIFTAELGISPKQYILKKKMEEGYRLLVQTSMPINKISEILCFSSPYHFTNEFKMTFSQTPSQVRNMENNSKAKLST